MIISYEKLIEIYATFINNFNQTLQLEFPQPKLLSIPSETPHIHMSTYQLTLDSFSTFFKMEFIS